MTTNPKFAAFVNALRKFVTDHFVPVWGTPARLVRTNGFKKGSWGFVLFDFADAPNALAYHDLTPVGLPLSKMFVKTMMSAHRTINSCGGA